ncbi:MAG: bacillithiol biosynthesis cysteine-adding enzyme BshC [Cyclobacteriaceae bacterium]|nr:bacillithiol biosynthesis cysteine-adding enzyme BshC [Cyclobacteriaceae bacterium]
MPLQKIPFRSAHAFSEFFLKYIEQDEALKPFYGRFPSPEAFQGQLKDKSGFPASARNTLVKVLQRQYESVKQQPAVEANIRALGDAKTFTVTTGHQLSVFTGPLYFVFKIATVIQACRQLKAKYPAYHFVPVYWAASEDHDYEEIKSFRLNGKKYTWETDQQGAVGRFHTQDFKKLLAEVPGEIGLFRDAYTRSATLGEAVRRYVNALFGEEGLIVVDADDRELKRLLQPVMSADVFEHTPFQTVEATNKKLEALGYHPQVNPREINFFYLEPGLRSRIERQGDGFVVVDTALRFTKEELLQKMEQTPEQFSPNVILRPLYQELILPNLAYVGGPAELVYWLELKGVFDLFKTPFPILLPRNFGLIVDAPTARKMSKTRLHLEAFFESKNELFKRWVIQHSSHDLSLDAAANSLAGLMEEVKRRSEKIDPTLGPMTEAHATRMLKAMRTIEQKMMRAEKRKQSDGLRQVEAVKDALFPNGGLQERTDNFLNFYQTDPGFIQKLIEHFDPFDFQFHVLTYHEQEGTSKAVS